MCDEPGVKPFCCAGLIAFKFTEQRVEPVGDGVDFGVAYENAGVKFARVPGSFGFARQVQGEGVFAVSQYALDRPSVSVSPPVKVHR